MVESFLAWFLTWLLKKLLGDFLEMTHVSLQLLTGEIQLSNVRVKMECVNELGLVVVAKECVVGRIVVAVPWIFAWSRAVRITVEDILLLCQHTQGEKDEQTAKKRTLILREMFASDRLKHPSKDVASLGPSWKGRLIAYIVNMVHVSVGRVHLRFESQRFACGASVIALLAEPSKHVKSGVVSSMCELQSLSVYWDSRGSSLMYSSPVEFVARMGELICKAEDAKESEHQFILWPLSGKAKVEVEMFGSPKVIVQARLQEIRVDMMHQQFRDLAEFFERCTLDQRNASYHQLKPTKGESRRQWWKYVITAVQQDLELKRKMFSKKWMMQMVCDRRDYIEIWAKGKVVGGAKKLSLSDRSSLQQIELRRSLSTILEFRHLGELLYERGKKQDMQGNCMFGHEKMFEEISVSGTLLHVLLREEDAAKTVSSTAMRSKKAEKGQEKFVAEIGLTSVKLQLAKHKKELFCVNFGSWEVNFSTGLGTTLAIICSSLQAAEFISSPGQKTQIFGPKGGYNGQFFEANAQLWPPDLPAVDLVLKLVILPLDFVISGIVVREFVDFFDIHDLQLEEMLVDAEDIVKSVLENVVAQVRYSAKVGARMIITADVGLPDIIFPANATENNPRFIVALGRLALTTATFAEEEAASELLPDRQQFDFTLCGMHVLLENEKCCSTLVQDINVGITALLERQAEEMMPKVNASAQVSAVKVMFTTEALLTGLDVVKSFDSTFVLLEKIMTHSTSISKHVEPKPKLSAEVDAFGLDARDLKLEFGIEGVEFVWNDDAKQLSLVLLCQSIELKMEQHANKLNGRAHLKSFGFRVNGGVPWLFCGGIDQANDSSWVTLNYLGSFSSNASDKAHDIQVKVLGTVCFVKENDLARLLDCASDTRARVIGHWEKLHVKGLDLFFGPTVPIDRAAAESAIVKFEVTEIRLCFINGVGDGIELCLSISLFFNKHSSRTEAQVDVTNVLAKSMRGISDEKNSSMAKNSSMVKPCNFTANYLEIASQEQRVSFASTLVDIAFSRTEFLILSSLLETLKTKEQEPAMKLKILLEPPPEHRRTSLLYLMLVAEPMSLLSEPEKFLSVNLATFDVNGLHALNYGVDSVSTWLLRNGKMIAGCNPQIGLVVDLRSGFVAGKKTERSEMADWIFSTEDGRLRLAADPAKVLSIEKGNVVLGDVGSNHNQIWVFGARKTRASLPQVKTCTTIISQSCSMVLEGVKFRIVDDELQGQVLLEVQQIHVDLVAWSSELSLVLHFDLQADLFNAKLQKWEPIIRGLDDTCHKDGAWILHANLTQVDGVLHANIVAPRIFSMSVTQLMASSVKKLATVWMGKVEEEVKPANKSCYLLQNETGGRITWAVCNGSKVELDCEKGKNWAEWVNENSEVNLPTLSVFIPSESGLSLERLPMDGVCSLSFQVRERYILSYTIKNRHRTRVLRLGSNLKFVSEVELESVMVFCQNSLIGIVEPKSYMVAPVEIAFENFSLGKACTEELDQDSLRRDAVETEDGIMVLGKRMGGEDTLFCVLAAGTPDAARDDIICWTVTIRAPLRVRNFLNTDIWVRVRDKHMVIGEREVCLKPCEVRVFLFDVSAVAVRYADHEWSHYVSTKSVNVFRFAPMGDVMVTNDYDNQFFKRGVNASRTLSFWFQFWIVNNSGHHLEIQELSRVLTLKPDIFIAYSGKYLHIGVEGEKSRTKVKLASSLAAGTIAIAEKSFGVSLFTAPSEYWRTRVLQFDERYQLVNMCDRRICVRQTQSTQSIFLEPGEQRWYQFQDATLPQHMQVQVAEESWLWSGSFELKEVSRFEIVVSRFSGVRTHLTVQTTTNAPITGVIIRPSLPDAAVYRVVNKTRTAMVVRQARLEGDAGEWLNPGDNIPFAWHVVAMANLMAELSFPWCTLLNENDEVLNDEIDNLPSFSLDAVSVYKGMKLKFGSTSEVADPVLIEVRVYFDNASKVLEVVEIIEMRGGLKFEEGGASKEEDELEKNVTKSSLIAQFRGFCLSLSDGKSREILLAQANHVCVSLQDGTTEMHVELDVDSFQVDNMMLRPQYPVVFWSKQSPIAPFVHVSLNMSKEHDGIIFLNGLEFVVQEVEIRVDECFAASLVAVLVHFWSTTVDLESPVAARPIPDFRKDVPVNESMMYARVFYIGPLSVLFSYSSSPLDLIKYSSKEMEMADKYLSYLNEINSVRINLGMLKLDNMYLSVPETGKVLVQHYEWQALQCFFSLLGAVPVLGAPSEMFQGFSSGVSIIFFPPSLGRRRTAEELGHAVGRSAAALLQGTVGTFFQEAGKVTTAASKLAAKLTFDDDYKRKRMLISKGAAKNIGQGLLFAGRDIGVGAYNAIVGVVLNPVHGAQSDGARGFAIGIGAGLAGLVTKPVVGVLDATSQISRGIQNQTRAKKDRTRWPRAFDDSTILQVYDEAKAEAQEVLEYLDGGKHRLSVSQLLFPGLIGTESGSRKQESFRVLITNKAIFTIKGSEAQKMKSIWSLELGSVQNILVKGLTIEVHDTAQECHDLCFESPEEAIFVSFKLSRAVQELSTGDDDVGPIVRQGGSNKGKEEQEYLK